MTFNKVPTLLSYPLYDESIENKELCIRSYFQYFEYKLIFQSQIWNNDVAKINIVDKVPSAGRKKACRSKTKVLKLDTFRQ